MKKSRNGKIPEMLHPEEVQSIIAIPNKRVPTGLRNKAILSILWDTGGRVSDIINLRPADLNITDQEVLYRNGKNGVDRWASFPEHTADLLAAYKKQRPKGQYFFCTLEGHQLDRHYLYAMIRRYAKRAGINNKKIGLHSIRHSFATDYLKKNPGDLATLQKIMGHQSIKTTSVYLHYSKDDVMEGMKKYHNKLYNKKAKLAEKIASLEDQIQELKDSME